MYHVPVLLEEVISLLKLQPGHNVIDCTVGGGGHAEAMLRAIAPNGKLLGIDQDKEALTYYRLRVTSYELHNRVVLVHDNFRNLGRIIQEHNFYPVNAVLLDLGMSSYQLADSGRGFSFQRDSPLDMKFNGGVPTNVGIKTAYSIVNEYPKQKLAKIFKTYGEIHSPGVIAQRIVRARNARSIKTTRELVSAILGPAATRQQKRSGGQERARDPRGWPPKTVQLLAKVFQAIRIEVNDELAALSETFPQITRALSKGGRVAILSYHSLEDRIVKQYFKEAASVCICPKEFPVCMCNHPSELDIITRGAVTATDTERACNQRSRSAKLRAAERI